MDDKGSVGKISVSSDSVSTLNSEDFVLVSRLGDETPSSTNNGSDDEKTGLKVRTVGCRSGRKHKGKGGGLKGSNQRLSLLILFLLTSVTNHDCTGPSPIHASSLTGCSSLTCQELSSILLKCTLTLTMRLSVTCTLTLPSSHCRL